MKYELVSHYPSTANAPLWTVVIKSRLSNVLYSSLEKKHVITLFETRTIRHNA